MILEQVYPLEKHLGRVCKSRHSVCPGEGWCLEPAWFLPLQGVECWDLSSGCNPSLLPRSPYQPMDERTTAISSQMEKGMAEEGNITKKHK